MLRLVLLLLTITLPSALTQTFVTGVPGTPLVVTVAPKPSDSPVATLGYPDGFFINGLAQPVLQLQRGSTYTFDLTAVPGIHPFYITDNSVGAGSGTVLAGPATGSILTYTPDPSGSGDLTLYYNCAVHPNMGYQITVSDPVSNSSSSTGGSSTGVVGSTGTVSSTGVQSSTGVSGNNTSTDAIITDWPDVTFVPYNNSVVGDWSNLYWSWLWKQPVNETTGVPLIMNETGMVNCSTGVYTPQSTNNGTSWFLNLAGDSNQVWFASPPMDAVGAPIQRTCNEPLTADTSLFIPLFTLESHAVWQNTSDAVQLLPDTVMLQCANNITQNATVMLEITSSAHGGTRSVENVQYSFVAAQNAIIADAWYSTANWAAGRYLLQSAGYYVWIKALPPGDYIIHALLNTTDGATVCGQSWHVDLSYVLSVSEQRSTGGSTGV